MFADDTVMFIADKNVKVAYAKMTSDLEKLDDWLKYNKLALNLTKTNYMLITNKRKSTTTSETLHIENREIKKTSCVKYLGVLLDDKLSFIPQNEYIRAKLNKKLGLLRRISSKLTKESKLTFYKSIVAPHFDYCSSILFLLTDSQIADLQIIMNKFMRIILVANRETHIEDMLRSLNVLSVQQRIKYNVIKIFCKMERGLVPEYLMEKLVRREENLSYAIRTGHVFMLQKYNKTINQRSLFYKGLKMYNNFREKNNCSGTLREISSKCNDYVKTQC